jgi:phosphatidylserine/phosphatidylglycerophosphate/cardiolipin synthase-like enzyme
MTLERIMHGRRLAADRPVRLAFCLLACHASCMGARVALGDDHIARELPPNAVQPPGSQFESYPKVGAAQGFQIFKEIVHGTAATTLRRPLYSTAKFAHRFSERIVVRSAELVPPALTGRCRSGPREPDETAWGADLGGAGGTLPLPAHLTLLPSSERSIQALLALIASARARIDIMMYGWDDDATGREVADALSARANEGVRVRVMVDRTGFLIHNAAAAHSACTFLDQLRLTPNVTVIEPSGAFVRLDHRKLAIIDDRIAWSGGMILGDVARRQWHNLAYLVEGPIAGQLAGTFAERWHELGGASEGPCRAAVAEVSSPANATVRMIKTDIDERSLKDAIYHAVDHARCSITLENPYFSDQILIKKLVAARSRGVDVRAILTLRGNVRALNQFEMLTANRLLRGGVRVWLYPAMTHVKAMSADGVWAYIGTGNFDELSLRNNREVGLSVSSPEVVRELDATLFAPDFAVSQELKALLPTPKNRLELEALSLWF